MLPPIPSHQTVRVVGREFISDLIIPPGIVTGAAYADLDAIGTFATVDVPASGIIQQVSYYDMDDEGLQVDVWLLNAAPAAATDNSALAWTDDDNRKVIDVIQFTSFRDGNLNQFSSQRNLGIPYNAPSRKLYFQLQARGALNIAAANLPGFVFRILADE